MTKIVYLLTALFVLNTAVFAQQARKEKISGIVKTSDSYPAENITVYLKGTPYGAITNNKGYFELEAPAGNYTMEIYSITAHKKEFPITVKSGETNHFDNLPIIENRKQLEEVVVTGQFSPQSIRNSVYKVKVISSQQIQQKSATNVQSLLNTEIGIRLSNDMALGETDFEIMGMSGNNVKVLMDGIPMIDRLSTKQSLSQIDINTIERIEIVEGPMSVIYGTDALAGVINIITKKGATTSGNRFRIGARLQEESIGDEYDFLTKKGIHDQNVNAGYSLENGLFFAGSFTRNRFGGWQGDLTGRKKQWQPKDQLLTEGQIGISKPGFNLSYKLNYLNENLLTEADINSANNTTSDKEFIVNRYTHQLQGDMKANEKLKFSFAGSYQDYSRRTRTTNIDLNTGQKTLSLNAGEQDETTFSAWFARVMAVWNIQRNLSLQPGFELQSDSGVGQRIPGNHRITNTAFFLSAEYSPLEWLFIRPGFRTSFNSAFDAPLAVPALNVKASLAKDLDLRASYAYGFRSPTLQELYYSFHDANHNIDGNPDLKAEYSNSYQLSLTWRAVHNEEIRFTPQLTGFYNDFRDRITMIENVNQPGYNIYDNMDKYKTTGATLENTLYWKSLRATLNFSYVGRYNKLSDDQKYDAEDLPVFRFSPEISSSITYDWSKIATISLFYKFTGKRKEYYVNSNKLELLGMDSFNWADVTVSRPIGKYLTASVGVKNIFDITTVLNSASSGGAHGGGSGASQMGCGRSYFVGLLFNLER